MRLVVNGSAVRNSSIGVRRYYESVARHLQWPGGVSLSGPHGSRALDRAAELMRRGSDSAIFWSPAQRGPLRARHHVVTVHDCINVEYTYAGDWRLPALKWATQQLLGHAEVVVAISRATRDAVVRNYDVDSVKLVVVPSSCQVDLGEGSRGDAQDPGHADVPGPPFILLVTNHLAHKNAVRACQAIANSRARQEGVGLVVIGSIAQEALSACKAGGLQVSVRRGIADTELRLLYERCLFLIAPSLDEGHDLPVAEVLALHGNVLCSDIPAHREFYSDCARFFDPLDIDEMTAAVDNSLDHTGRWFPDNALPSRTFQDVAADYRQLFSNIR